MTTLCLNTIYHNLQRHYPEFDLGQWLLVDATTQQLLLMQQATVVTVWPVSTAKAGLGSAEGSYKTPLGVHYIVEKHGEAAPIGGILKGRCFTGEVANIITDPVSDERDLITTRILWLAGLQPGINQGDEVDSYQRYIYIHGTQEEGLLGQPVSQGCIRMSNQAVLDLFNQVQSNTLVLIVADGDEWR